jgi:hypothetical protein
MLLWHLLLLAYAHNKDGNMKKIILSTLLIFGLVGVYSFLKTPQEASLSPRAVASVDANEAPIQETSEVTAGTQELPDPASFDESLQNKRKILTHSEILENSEAQDFLKKNMISEGEARDLALNKGLDLEFTANGFHTKEVTVPEGTGTTAFQEKDWVGVEKDLLTNLTSDKTQPTENDLKVVELWKKGQF